MFSRFTTLEISKEYLNFSAAHFTVFSAQERERLHGHNFQLKVSLVAPVHRSGLSFDYRTIKAKLKAACQELDEYLLIPEHCEHLIIEKNDTHYKITFNHQEMFFLHEDVKLLALSNITVEELSHYFLEKVLEDEKFISSNNIQAINMQVSSGAKQWGCVQWQQTKG